MNRRAAATILGLALVGCAQGRSAMPGVNPGTAPDPFAPIPRVQDTINAGLPPRVDARARRARLDGAPPRRRRVVPAPAPASGPPSPFAVPAPAAVRPRTVPVEPAPEPASAPAPEAAPAPVSPERDTSPGPGAAPSATPAPEAAPALPELPIPDAPPGSALKGTLDDEPAHRATPPPDAPPDPALRPTSGTMAAPAGLPVLPPERGDSTRATSPRRLGMPISLIAATVGKEDITMGDLQTAIKERLGSTPKANLTPEQKNQLAKSVLDSLIQRALLIQAAKRKVKTEKNWDQFMQQTERVWREHELPELIQKAGVADAHELKEAMKRRGLSLDNLREAFKLKVAAGEFLRAELAPKIKVDLPEVRGYYEEHLKDYDRPAKITWREVAVEVGKHRDRAEARRKAEAVLARIRRGEDFAKVAKAEGEGPNAQKGGFWETSPGSYGIPAVNDALGTLPLRQVSPILEGPDSFHVIVVEARRSAGPASFEEVNLEIRDMLREQKYDKAVEAYLAKLRSRTLITSMFDGTPSGPSLSNAGPPEPEAAGR